jgi:hypothetical protein
MTGRNCLRHSRKASSRGWRLVLARQCLDRDAEQLIIDEHQDCPACLAATVEALADAAHSLMIRSWGVPNMDEYGTVTGQGITWLYDLIDDHLACESRDRGDLERGP